MKTLVVAQGPTQALAALAVIRNLVAPSANTTNRSIDDANVHFAVGDFCAGNSTDELFLKTKQLINANGYNTIYNTSHLDAQYYSGALTFKTFCGELRKLLQETQYRRIYVCRRMALLNEAVVTLYSNSKKICYGDGFGGLDNGRQKWCKPISQSGFKQIDECVAVAPFEENYRGALRKPVSTAGVSALKSVLDYSLKALRPDLEVVRVQAGSNNSLGIITTSNLTESGSAGSFKQEINYYIESIMSCALREPQTMYLIKGHPRQTRRQAETVAEELRTSGLNCTSLRAHSCVPTELLIRFLKPATIIPLLSSSGYMARLLDPNISVHYSPSAEKITRIWLNNQSFKWHHVVQRLQALTLLSSYPWESCVSYVRLWINSIAFRNIGIRFPAFPPTTLAKQQARFARYQASISALALVAAHGARSRAKFLRSFIE